MPPIDEPASFESKEPATERRKTKTAGAAPDSATSPDLVAFTLDAAAGRLVSIERVDGAGARHALSEGDRARLATADARVTLKQVVEQAFEAGIDCLLGEETGETDASGSQEDAELSRMLLRSLMERSAVRQLMQGEVLIRAIVGTLMERAAGLGGAASDSSVAH